MAAVRHAERSGHHGQRQLQQCAADVHRRGRAGVPRARTHRHVLAAGADARRRRARLDVRSERQSCPRQHPKEPASRRRHRHRAADRRDPGRHHRHRCSQRQADHGGGARVPVQCRHDRHRRRPEDQRSQGSGSGQGRRGHHVRAHGDGDRGRRERGDDVPAARRRQEHLRTRRRHARRPERRHRRRRHRAAAEIPRHLRQGDHIRFRCEAAVHCRGVEWHCGKHRTRRVRQCKLDERRRFLINASQAGAIRLPPRLVQL